MDTQLNIIERKIDAITTILFRSCNINPKRSSLQQLQHQTGELPTDQFFIKNFPLYKMGGKRRTRRTTKRKRKRRKIKTKKRRTKKRKRKHRKNKRKSMRKRN